MHGGISDNINLKKLNNVSRNKCKLEKSKYLNK
jgi:hypothetical protein